MDSNDHIGEATDKGNSLSQNIESRNSVVIGTNDFILLVLTCLAAPLVSHFCDLVFGFDNNQLSSEKLLCTYFIIISLDVFYQYIFSILKKMPFWNPAWNLDDSSTIQFALFVVGASIVIGYYDTLIGMCIITAIILLSFILLWKNPTLIKISAGLLILYAVMAAVVIPCVMIDAYGDSWRASPLALIVILVSAIIVQTAVSVLMVFTKKVLLVIKKHL